MCVCVCVGGGRGREEREREARQVTDKTDGPYQPIVRNRLDKVNLKSYKFI